MNEPIHILIVDDRPENLVALESLLDKPGWIVVKANSGNEALQLILEHDFALVLLDVQMPDMNGFETAELMRANPKTRRIPIIFVTAISREQQYVFKGYESGAVDYIFKPIEPTILTSKVRVFAELYLQRREIQNKQVAVIKANRELVERNRKLQDELELARRVQLGFLPAAVPHHARAQFGHHYLICSTLGGDLYDIFPIGDNHMGLYIADVSGHGVSAALLAGLLKMAFDSFKPQRSRILQPHDVVGRLNGMLFGKLPRDAFITFIYAVADLQTYTLKMAIAGHPKPLLCRPSTGQTVPIVCPHGPALGLLEQFTYPLGESKIEPGDMLVFFTDGITEAMNSRTGEEFGDERLQGLLHGDALPDPSAAVNALPKAVELHRDGSDVNDDCTLVCMQVR